MNGHFEEEDNKDRVLDTLFRLLEQLNLNASMTKGHIKRLKKSRSTFIKRQNLSKWARDAGFWRWWTFTEDAIKTSIIDARYEPDSQGGLAKDYGLQGINAGYLAFLWMRADAVYNSEMTTP